jgi:hypothetical protein
MDEPSLKLLTQSFLRDRKKVLGFSLASKSHLKRINKRLWSPRLSVKPACIGGAYQAEWKEKMC